MANTSIQNKNIVIVETVVMYGISNEIDVSVVVFCLKVSVVLTLLCWILDPVCKTMHYNFHTWLSQWSIIFGLINLVSFILIDMCDLML